MSYVPVLDLLDRMIAETVTTGNALAAKCANGDFDRLGMEAGLGQRLQTLNEIKSAVVTLGLQEHEQPDKYYHPDGF
jgi:hypothetical protein